LSVLDQSLQHHKTRMEKLKNQKLIWLVKSWFALFVYSSSKLSDTLKNNLVHLELPWG
jgi:hypothetical protein